MESLHLGDEQPTPPAGPLPGEAELVHTASHWTVLPHSREGQTNKKAHRVLRGSEGCGGRPPRRAIQAAPEFRGREVLDPALLTATSDLSAHDDLGLLALSYLLSWQRWTLWNTRPV